MSNPTNEHPEDFFNSSPFENSENDFPSDSQPVADFNDFPDLSSDASEDRFPDLDTGESDFSADETPNESDPFAELSSSDSEETEKPKKGKKDKKSAKGKKEKKPKAKKEKTEKSLGKELVFSDYLALGFTALMVLIILIVNVVLLLRSGQSNVIMFLIYFDLIGICVSLVPFILWKCKQKLTMYDVCMGLTIAALAIGSICLLIERYRYNFLIRPSGAAVISSQFDTYNG